jgi:hypothetical protein
MKSALKWFAMFLVAFLAVAIGGPPAAHAATLAPDLHLWLVPIAGATVGANVVTLTDLAKRMLPTGAVESDIVEMLTQTNAILDNMHFEEGNLPTGNRSTIRTGLPAVYWRLLNQGTPSSKSLTAQVDDQAGILEAWSEIDEEIVNLANDKSATRLGEAASFIEAMNQEMAQTLFYGNVGTAPEEFTGLAPRYSSLSAANAQNIIDAGGTGADNTSIWVVQWHRSTVFGIVPRGSKVGLSREDLGRQVAETTSGLGGSRMMVYREHFVWRNGLVVKDWRGAVRIANIDISNLVGNTSAADLLAVLTRATYRIPNPNLGRVAIYMNRTVGEFLDIQSKNAVSTGGQLSYADVQGRRVQTFRGIPIYIVDQILETEARVT